jgi:hypothetical protein
MVMYKKTRMRTSGLYYLTYIQLEARFEAELELCKVTNPSTTILGIANVHEHVILQDNKIVQNKKIRQGTTSAPKYNNAISP